MRTRQPGSLALAATILLFSCAPDHSPTAADGHEVTVEVTNSLASGPPRNEASQRLLKMSDTERLVTFRDVVNTSRGQCAAVTSAEPRRSLDGADVWVIQCSDTGQWAVKVDPDSTTHLLSCSFLANQGTPCEIL
jgi:hypothetical protein